MKIYLPHPAIDPREALRRAETAYTLTEVLVATSIFSLVIAAALLIHLIGLHMCQITKAKLGASDEARAAISKLVDEIRSSKIIKVGSGSLTGFTEIAIGALHQGNSVQIHSTTNTNAFIRYFWDSSDSKLKRTTNGSSASYVIAHFITNQLVFTAEDHLGNVLTNHQNNRVLGLKLEFYQIQYPVMTIGPGQLIDYYRLSTKITRRALE